MGFALRGEDVLDRRVLPALDFCIEVDERPMELPRGSPSNGGFSDTRKTDKDDIRRQTSIGGLEGAEAAEIAEKLR